MEEHSYHLQSMEIIGSEGSTSNAQACETSLPNLINPLFWNRSATLLLINKFIKHRVGHEAGQYRKKQMWEKVQKEIMAEGYPFNSEQIAGRWKTLMRAYRNSKDLLTCKSGTKAKKYEYQDELDALFALDPCIHSEIVYGANDNTNPNEMTAQTEGTQMIVDPKNPEPAYQSDVNPLFWNKPATLALIKEFWKHKEDQEEQQYTMKHLWEKIENAMMLQGHPYNAEQISGRWKTLMRGYKVSKEYDPSSGKKFKKYEFFDELDALYASDEDRTTTMKRPASKEGDEAASTSPVVRRRKRRKLRSSAKDDLDLNNESIDSLQKSDETPLFWNRAATLTFINELKKYTIQELGQSRKKRMWQQIQKSMVSKGYPFNFEQICGRWKTLLRGYKNAKSATNPKKYEFQDELETLFTSDSCVLPDWVKNSSLFGENESDFSDDDDDNGVVSTGRLSSMRPRRQHSLCKEVVELLKQLMEDQNRREKEDIARQERMHRERICVLQNLIQAITQNVALRPTDFM